MKMGTIYLITGITILLAGLLAQYQTITLNQEQEKPLVEYYRRWHYEGRPAFEHYTITTKGRYTYTLETDYQTTPITKTLTRKEQETLNNLIEQVTTEQQPESKTLFAEKTKSGDLRIPSKNFRVTFNNDNPEEAPTTNIQQLITYLQHIKKQQE